MLWIHITVYAMCHLINRFKLLRIIDNVTLVYITGVVFYSHVDTNLKLQKLSICCGHASYNTVLYIPIWRHLKTIFIPVLGVTGHLS